MEFEVAKINKYKIHYSQQSHIVYAIGYSIGYAIDQDLSKVVEKE